MANNQNNCTAHWKLADAMLEANDSSEDALSELNQSIDLCPTLMQARVDRARALSGLANRATPCPIYLWPRRIARPSHRFIFSWHPFTGRRARPPSAAGNAHLRAIAGTIHQAYSDKIGKNEAGN